MKNISFLFVIFFFSSKIVHGQCTLSCKNFVEIVLDSSCAYDILYQDVHDGSLNSQCSAGNLVVEMEINSAWVPAILNNSHLNQTLNVRLRDLVSAEVCSTTVLPLDTLPPYCVAPPDLTILCSNFTSPLSQYGTFTAIDSCCIDSIFEYVDYILYDSICNYGIITRNFSAFDYGGNSTNCAQKITIPSNYYIKFPDDVTVFECASNGMYGIPELYNLDCENIAVTFTDSIITVVPDACYKIERKWQINGCSFNPLSSCEFVSNPSGSNLGPLLSPFEPNSGHPYSATNSSYYNQYLSQLDTAGNLLTDCWSYTQTIKIIDSDNPILNISTNSCDTTDNNPYYYNSSALYNGYTSSHDLCEGLVNLSIVATDSCAGANINVRYLLFLDTDGDGSMETVINSQNAPVAATINIGNAGNPSFSGGTPVVFDTRPVSPSQLYRFGLKRTTVGSQVNASVVWKEAGQYTDLASGVTAELPYGTHIIKWVVEDGCGNEAVEQSTFSVIDCKPPVLICETDTLSFAFGWDSTILVQDGILALFDNCGPINQINTGLCIENSASSGSCNGSFPTYPLQSSLIIDSTFIGYNDLYFGAIDYSGNTSSCLVKASVEEAFSIQCPNQINVNTDCTVDVPFSNPVISTLFSYIHPTVSVSSNSAIIQQVSPDSYVGNFSIGIHNIDFVVSGIGGFSKNCTFVINVDGGDTIPPVLNCSQNQTHSNALGSCTALVFLPLPVGTDNCAITTPNYIPSASGVSIYNLGSASVGLFPIGTSIVIFSGTDDVGNTGTCSLTVTVQDLELPLLVNCPSNIQVCGGVSGRSVTWNPPTASDNCPGFFVNASHNSGDNFLPGSTIVSYLVTDANGNTASCTFNVNVTPAPNWYVDSDNDGFGAVNATAIYACIQPANLVNNNLDCDDNSPSIHPNVVEVCDGVDNNCNGQVDEVGSEIIFNIKALLDGPTIGGIMSDQLRVETLIPTQEPYTQLGFLHISGGNEFISNSMSVFSDKGDNSIVDWLFVELRDPIDPTIILVTKSCLIQRDGDLVETDGESSLGFSIAQLLNIDSFYISIRHRNHLGVMTANSIAKANCGIAVDFTSPTLQTWGINAQKNIGGKMCMWAGDANQDGLIKYNGSNSDKIKILIKVGFATPNNVVSGYHTADINMDGLVKYNGTSCDRIKILMNVGLATPNNIVYQQLP